MSNQFFTTMPAAQAPAARSAKPDATPLAAAVAPRPAAPALLGSALVVDDEPLVRSLVCHMLKRAGLAVQECASGSDALDRLATVTTPFDVVVLDMTMPGLSGIETATRIRASHPSLPVVLTSGCSPPDLDARVVTAFIQKPYKPAELVALVTRVLGAARR